MHVYIVLLMAKKSTYVFLCVAITKQLYLTFLLTFDAGHIWIWLWKLLWTTKYDQSLLVIICFKRSDCFIWSTTTKYNNFKNIIEVIPNKTKSLNEYFVSDVNCDFFYSNWSLLLAHVLNLYYQNKKKTLSPTWVEY